MDNIKIFNMKVLIFTSQFFQIGGAERLAVELAIDLNKKGIHADILSMYERDLPGVLEKENEIKSYGVPNIYYLGLKVHPTPIKLLNAIFKFKKIVEKECYDVVETSSITPSIIAVWGLINKQTKLVVGLHQVYEFPRDNSIQHKIFRWSIKSNSRIRFYSVSNFSCIKWSEYSKTPFFNTRCVYNSIPDDCFNIKRDNYFVENGYVFPSKARIILYVGRIVSYKHPETILDALSDVCEKENLVIVFVGRIDYTVDGTTDMIKHMNKIISSKNLYKRVLFLGNSLSVPQIMNSVDLLVHPTNMEAFGLVLVEAMATGLQIVTTDVEGIPEVVEGTDTICVKPLNPVLLYDAILKTLRRNESEIATAIEKGKNKAELYRTNARTLNMIKLFDDLLSGDF